MRLDSTLPARPADDAADGFVLDVRVVQDDASRPAGQVPCDTSNGCPATCDSSCNSSV
ncbi:hypothetical protein ABT299_50075 [Spirillospora sp. NPDC000708]